MNNYRFRFLLLWVLLIISEILPSFKIFPQIAYALDPTNADYEWGIRSFAEELPRYTALKARLEKEAGDFDRRHTDALDKLQLFTSKLDTGELDEINRAFEARGITGFERGGRLLYYHEEYEDAQKGLIEFPPEDISKDDTVSMSARGLSWSTHIRYLKAQKEYFRYRAIIAEEKNQFALSHMSNFSRSLGADLDHFVDDTFEDIKFIVVAHGIAFFDELSKCAFKEVTHILKNDLLFPGRYGDSPGVPGTRPLPGVDMPGNPGVVVECLTDAVRASVVHAMENAIKINFLQDMRDAGIPREVALYWWSRYILERQKPEIDDPMAPRIRSLKDAFADTICNGIKSQFSLEGANEQIKKTILDEYENLIRGKARDAALEWSQNELMKDLIKAKDLKTTEDAFRRFKEQNPEDLKRIAKKNIEESTRLKFSKHLDWAIMLIQEGAVYDKRTQKVADFKKITAPLIEEYRRIVMCLDKGNDSSSGMSVVGFYKMSPDVQKEFFRQCDATEADEHLILSRRLEREMRIAYEIAQGAAGIISQVCPEGTALAKSAGPELEGIKSLAKPLLEDLRTASARLPEAKSALEKVVAAGNVAAELGLKVVEAKQEAENEAAAACRAESEFSGAADNDGRKTAKRDGEKAASKAGNAAFRANQAYQQAEAVKNQSVGEGAASLTASVTGITALTGRLADVKGKIANLQASEAHLNQLAVQAEDAWYDLDGVRERARGILIEAAVLADAENSEVQEHYNEIRKFGLEIVGTSQGGKDEQKWAAMGSAYLQCPLNMRNQADQLGLGLNTLKLMGAALEEAETKLPKEIDLSLLKDRYDLAAADIVSAVDVSQIFSDAAQSFGADADNCLSRLLGRDMALKSATDKKKDEADETVPAFVTNSGDMSDDDEPAFVKNSGVDQEGSARVTDSSAGLSTSAKVTKKPATIQKKNSVADLYKSKTGWQDGIVNTGVKMDAQTKKTFGGVPGGKKDQKMDGNMSDTILGVDFEEKHSGGEE